MKVTLLKISENLFQLMIFTGDCYSSIWFNPLDRLEKMTFVSIASGEDLECGEVKDEMANKIWAMIDNGKIDIK